MTVAEARLSVEGSERTMLALSPSRSAFRRDDPTASSLVRSLLPRDPDAPRSRLTSVVL